MTSDTPEPDRGSSLPPETLDSTRAVILAIAFVVVLLIAISGLTSNDGSPSAGSAAAQPPATTTTVKKHVPATTTTTAPKSTVKVQVANGTSTSGLATTVTNTLQVQGWDMQPPLNATSSVATSAVYFAPGFAWAASEVAHELALPANSVRPITPSVPVAGITGDDVVVVAGPNLASSST